MQSEKRTDRISQKSMKILVRIINYVWQMHQYFFHAWKHEILKPVAVIFGFTVKFV